MLIKAAMLREMGLPRPYAKSKPLEIVEVDLGGPQRTLADPEQLLKHLRATPMPGIYVLLDFHPYLKDPVNVRLLKDIAQGYDRVARTVVLMRSAESFVWLLFPLGRRRFWKSPVSLTAFGSFRTTFRSVRMPADGAGPERKPRGQATPRHPGIAERPHFSVVGRNAIASETLRFRAPQ